MTAEVVEMVAVSQKKRFPLDMRIRIDALTKEVDRLEGVCRTKTTELHAACERCAGSCTRLSKSAMNSRSALTAP